MEETGRLPQEQNYAPRLVIALLGITKIKYPLHQVYHYLVFFYMVPELTTFSLIIVFDEEMEKVTLIAPPCGQP